MRQHRQDDPELFADDCHAVAYANCAAASDGETSLFAVGRLKSAVGLRVAHRF